MDPISVWIRVQVIPIPALLGTIPDPDLDPLKSGIVTPLVQCSDLRNVYPSQKPQQKQTWIAEHFMFYILELNYSKKSGYFCVHHHLTVHIHEL